MSEEDFCSVEEFLEKFKGKLQLSAWICVGGEAGGAIGGGCAFGRERNVFPWDGDSA